MLLLCTFCAGAARALFGLKSEGRAAVPLAVLGLLGALFLFPNTFFLRDLMAEAAPVVNLILAFAVPAALLGVAALRRLGTSCGGREQ